MASTYLIHGNAVTMAEPPGGSLERVNGIPWTEILGLRQGWGTTFRGRWGTFNWFHIPFPTPTVVNDVQSFLTRLDVLFDIEGNATVESIHLWGSTRDRWFMRDNLRLRSNATLTFERWDLHGVIGISVGVQFHESANITFRGASIQLA